MKKRFPRYFLANNEIFFKYREQHSPIYLFTYRVSVIFVML